MSSGVAALAAWPPDGLEEVDRCPVCGSGSRIVFYRDLTDRSYLCAPGRWQLYRCVKCRSAYLDPRPTASAVHLAYSNYYEGEVIAPDPSSTARTRRFRRALRNGYLNTRYGYSSSPASRLGPILVPLLPRRREEADASVRHLHLPSERARLLDVGCGTGAFAARMQALGWDAEGLEPSPDAAVLARSQGIRVRQGRLEDANLPSSAFDAATLRLVLEHLPDPGASLTAIRDALKTDGVLWIEAPNLDSRGHRTFGRDWIFLETPRHAVLFTSSSLVDLVTRLGFELVQLIPSRQASWSFRMSSAVARGRPPFKDPPRLSAALALKARITDLVAFVRPRAADVVVIVARKR